MNNKRRRKIIEHDGHRILLQPITDNDIKYSIYKFVNGEHFGISKWYAEDTKDNRDLFIEEAMEGFARARTAPFN